MALLLGANLILEFAPAVAVIHVTGPLGAALLGALLFPLARAIVESTDSTPPFFGRLEAAYASNSNFARGVVAGVGAWLALYLDLPGWSGFDRFLFGAAVGALAFAGVDAALDALELREERRQHLRSWRVYALGTLLGGLVAGAIAWYLDSGQIATIVSKFHAYVSLDYRADGRPVNAYVIRPLFSKWGATDLGMADGGVRVFYDELLSGVIQWVFAAPLFSINMFFLTALIQRSLKPLRQLASFEGLDLLIENAVRVLRWGLWMAPVIYSFLKASPDPTWYNQDGLVRTGVATWLNSTLPDNEFRQWSLDIFTALLAFDAPARPDLVRPHGAARRDAGQSVLHRRRHRRRKGGALPRQGADQPRHSRGHQAFRHLGAAVVAFLHSAWGRMGQGLERRRADDPYAAAVLPLSRQRLSRLRSACWRWR